MLQKGGCNYFMGLFDRLLETKVCCNCKVEDLSDLARDLHITKYFKTADNQYVCNHCLGKMQTVIKQPFNFTLSDSEQKQFASNITSDFVVNNLTDCEMLGDGVANLPAYINFVNEIIICNVNLGRQERLADPLKGNRCYTFSDIIKFENGQSTYEVTTGSSGHPIVRAIVGNAIAGPAGAVIGAMTSKNTMKTTSFSGELFIRIYFKDMHYYERTYGTKDLVTDFDRNHYVRENGIVKRVLKINEMESQQMQQATSAPVINTSSAADEIKKYSELLKEGIITQEEFDMKKKQLLGL